MGQRTGAGGRDEVKRGRAPTRMVCFSSCRSRKQAERRSLVDIVRSMREFHLFVCLHHRPPSRAARGSSNPRRSRRQVQVAPAGPRHPSFVLPGLVGCIRQENCFDRAGRRKQAQKQRQHPRSCVVDLSHSAPKLEQCKKQNRAMYGRKARMSRRGCHRQVSKLHRSCFFPATATRFTFGIMRPCRSLASGSERDLRLHGGSATLWFFLRRLKILTRGCIWSHYLPISASSVVDGARRCL